MNTLRLHFANHIIHLLPETRCFGIKRWLLRRCGAVIGSNTKICSSAFFMGNSRLKIGDNCWIGHQTVIMCSAPVTIGNNVNIAPCCYIGTGTHLIEPSQESIAGKGVSIPIIIGDGTWVCAKSIVLAGSQVGKKAIIAAGAVVKGMVSDLELVGGIPARHIKYYEDIGGL